mmetsp:Transcript_90667/g.210913  ORF Transcript_90667/g.210913 Transcript_90667/m.210913 type:complete len:208 (-) Transcript_90667:8-631(-)
MRPVHGLGNGQQPCLWCQRVVVRMALILQANRVRPLRVASLMECPHERVAVRGIVDLDAAVVDLGQSLDFHVITPLTLAVYPGQKLIEWFRHKLLEIVPLAGKILGAAVSHKRMVLGSAVQLVGEGPEKAVAVPRLLADHEGNRCRAASVPASDVWSLGHPRPAVCAIGFVVVGRHGRHRRSRRAWRCGWRELGEVPRAMGEGVVEA